MNYRLAISVRFQSNRGQLSILRTTRSYNTTSVAWRASDQLRRKRCWFFNENICLVCGRCGSTIQKILAVRTTLFLQRGDGTSPPGFKIPSANNNATRRPIAPVTLRREGGESECPVNFAGTLTL